MTEYLVVCAGVILVAAAMALPRAVRGPTFADRMIILQLMSTAGVSVLLLLAVAMDSDGLFDAGLVIALLASVTSALAVSRVRRRKGTGVVEP